MSLSALKKRMALRNRVTRLTPFGLVAAALFGITTILVVYPLLAVVRVILFDDTSGGIENVFSAYTAPGLAQAITDTLMFAALVVTGALLAGGALAWLTERSDLGMAKISAVVPLLPFLLPPLAGPVGWVLLASPRAGFLNAAIRDVTNSSAPSGPLNISSWPGLVLVGTAYTIPFAYLSMSAGFRTLNPALEEASRISGAGPLRTMWKVAVPAILPAVLAAIVLSLMVSVGQFSNPLIIGSPAGIEVLSVTIYREVTRTNDLGSALGLSLMLVLTMQAVILAQQFLLRTGRFATIGGRASVPTRTRLGAWKWPARLLILGYLACVTLLPLAALILVSLQPYWTSQVDWSSLSTTHYRQVFTNESTASALQTTIVLSILGATVMVFGLALMFASTKRSGAGIRWVTSAVTMLPAGIPHIVMAVGLLLAFNRGPIILYGTIWMLLVAYIVVYIPQASRLVSSAISSVGDELTEASRIAGGSELRTFIRVTVPLSGPGIIAAWLIVFVLMLYEVTASSILATTNTNVVGRLILDQWAYGSWPTLAALAMSITTVGLVVVSTVQILGNRFTRTGR